MNADCRPVQALNEISEAMDRSGADGAAHRRDSLEDFCRWRDTVERGQNGGKPGGKGPIQSKLRLRQASLLQMPSCPSFLSCPCTRSSSHRLHDLSISRPSRPPALVLKQKGNTQSVRCSVQPISTSSSAFAPFPPRRRVPCLDASLKPRTFRTVLRARAAVTVLQCIQTKETVPIHSSKSRMQRMSGSVGRRLESATRPVGRPPSVRIASILIDN